MQASWLIIGILATAVPNAAQHKAPIEGFTKSPGEHIVVQLEQPFVVRSVKGIVRRAQGDEEPLPHVLIEIQGPGNDRRIRRATSDGRGRFEIGHVAGGTYRFKMTLNGLQSIVGTITVSKKAAKQDELKIEMPIGV
jgi:hypothetical protein